MPDEVDKLSQEAREKILRSRFRNRRLMAWLCLMLMMAISLLIVHGILYVPGAAVALAEVTSLLGMIFTLFASVILAYIGASAYEHVRF